MLFFILTPGIAVTIPPKSSKNIVALVHALVFATVWHFTHKLVWHATEGFVDQSLSKILAAQAQAQAQAQAKAKAQSKAPVKK